MSAGTGARVAFIGLGAMGGAMAASLSRAGFAVRGYDPVAASLDRAATVGVTVAHTEADAARGSDTLILMVVNAAQAAAVLFDAGALDALDADGVVILMATCPPGAVEALAARVVATGRRFVDAPVSGGTVKAVAATLTIMVGAAGEDFARVRPVLDAMGGKVVLVGDTPGQGAVVKAVNQLLCGVHIAVAAEGLALAGRLGVDRTVLLDILGGSAAASWMLNDRGPRMLEAEPAVTSAIDIFVKDLGIVLDAGRDNRVALPLAAAAHQLFLASSGRGDGRADDSQVIRSYQALNGDG